jgi:hypothetical protein
MFRNGQKQLETARDYPYFQKGPETLRKASKRLKQLKTIRIAPNRLEKLQNSSKWSKTAHTGRPGTACNSLKHLKMLQNAYIGLKRHQNKYRQPKTSRNGPKLLKTA